MLQHCQALMSVHARQTSRTRELRERLELLQQRGNFFLDLDDQLRIAELHPQFVALTCHQRQLLDFFTSRVSFGTTLFRAVSYTHLRAHETRHDIVCRLLLEKKKK